METFFIVLCIGIGIVAGLAVLYFIIDLVDEMFGFAASMIFFGIVVAVLIAALAAYTENEDKPDGIEIRTRTVEIPARSPD
jgi:hypothetical protein